MPSDHEELRRGRTRRLDALGAEFRELASAAGMPIPGRISAIEDQGRFFAAAASLGEPEEGGQNVGLMHISTPNDQPLHRAEGADVPQVVMCCASATTD